MKTLIFNIKYRFKLFLANQNEEIRSNIFENFFYYPLGHLVEGLSAQTLGSFISDYEVINRLRIFFPFNNNLIIKEHRAMLNERRFSDKKRLRSLNVNSFFYIGNSINNNINLSPYELINKSLGVIVHSGTSGLEALLLNKPVLIFGNPIYNQFIPKKVNVNSSEELKEFFKNPQNFITPEN